MKKVTTLLALCLTLGVSSAFAQAGLNLYWDGCSDGGTSAKTFACDVNTGAAFSLYASVVLPAPMIQFLGTTAIVDVNVDDVTLPAWWQARPGDCRQNSVAVSFDPNAFVTNCVDIWNGAVPLSVLDLQPTAMGVHGANWLRINAGAVVPSGQEYDIPADGTELVVCKVTVNRAKTTGTGACAGCATAACIVLNECKLQTPAGAHDQTVTQEGTSRWVTWNGTPVGCPGTTPAVNRTWGAVKSLYR